MSRYRGTVTGRLTDAERDQIVHMAELGMRATQIARVLQRHPGTINFAMHALGVARLTLRRCKPYNRNGREVHSFSADEDAWITALRIQGYSTPKIATLATLRWGHPRNAATIGIRLKMLANAEEELNAQYT